MQLYNIYLRFYNSYFWKLYMKGYCHAQRFPYREDYKIMGKPILRASKTARIQIGKSLGLGSISRFNTIGVFQPTILTVMGELTIGDNVGMSGSSVTVQEKIVIGNNVMIGSGALIIDSDAHPIHPDDRFNPNAKIESRPVIIGSNVFIGARSIVLKGVEIGDGSVIGAGSVVVKSIPANCVAAGNPAKVLRYFEKRKDL